MNARDKLIALALANLLEAMNTAPSDSGLAALAGIGPKYEMPELAQHSLSGTKLAEWASDTRKAIAANDLITIGRIADGAKTLLGPLKALFLG